MSESNPNEEAEPVVSPHPSEPIIEPAPVPPYPAPPGTSARSPFMVWFIVTTLLNSIPVFGLLTGIVCILIGLIGAGTSKDPAGRAKFGGLAAGGAVGMVISAGICIAAVSNQSGF